MENGAGDVGEQDGGERAEVLGRPEHVYNIRTYYELCMEFMGYQSGGISDQSNNH